MDENGAQREEKQCRICLDGPDPELGRLIKPCLCKGSMSVRAVIYSCSEAFLTIYPIGPIVCTCEVLTDVAKHIKVPERLLRL